VSQATVATGFGNTKATLPKDCGDNERETDEEVEPCLKLNLIEERNPEWQDLSESL